LTILIAPLDQFHAAVYAMLRSASSGATKTYDGNPFGVVSYPSRVLHDLGGSAPTGPPMLGDGADVAVHYQLDSLGRTAVEAQALSVRSRAHMVQSDDAGGFLYPVTVPGWRCAERRTDLLVGLTPEGREPRQVFVDRVRYVFRWTPA
jgi:hypothetical protein